METLNAAYIEAQYRLWKQSPDSISEDWRYFFKGFELAGAISLQSAAHDDVSVQSRAEVLIHRFRDIGHLLACMDPLSACPVDHPLLNPEAFGLNPEDMDRPVQTPFPESPQISLKELIARLKSIYCHSTGVEYMHIQDPQEREWLQARLEAAENRFVSAPDDAKRILADLILSTQFEQFLNRAYVGVTRFSLEGGDVLIPALQTLLASAGAHGCSEVIMGMAHRGRLNVLAHILGKPYEEILGEFESCYDPDSLTGSGDVKYHTGYLADIKAAGQYPMRIYLVHNPSHLESVDPVVEGIARSRQDSLEPSRRRQVLPVLMHGDAAFAGQGVVAEVLNLSRLKGYETAGTVHVVINNQIGYTTVAEDARSTRYATDVAKMLMAPIFHVHGEDPEAVAGVMRLACDYRMAFEKDVVVDIICYRRYGHNEGDEPYFTQPLMYDRIHRRPPLSRIYADRLTAAGVVSPDEIAAMEDAVQRKLDAAFQAVHGAECPFPVPRFYEIWNEYHVTAASAAPAATGVPGETLIRLSRAMTVLPEGFAAHPKVQALYRKRLDAVEKGQGIDWAGAEALAFATLLSEGTAIRLSGQDVRRGTFSQRHASIVDMHSGRRHEPLNHLQEGQAVFSAYDSLLAETSVLGFEYGYALVEPRHLVLWEAQFGDFINNAQSVVDLYIASSEAKWGRQSGVTLLLPHGLEGQGPEHSSARPERFLQLCAYDNLQVCNPTTPAQYFHLLRRQMLRRLRKPLIVLTPKSLLRNPAAVSAADDLAQGGFLEVLDDGCAAPPVRRVLFCSGKLYYELVQKRTALQRQDAAIIRIEQYYPFPEALLRQAVLRYSGADQFVWVQEEPENMGAWWFIRPLLEKLLSQPVRYVGRRASSSPATGFPKIYRRDQDAILEGAFS